MSPGAYKPLLGVTQQDGHVSTAGDNSKVCCEELASECELFDSESPEKSAVQRGGQSRRGTAQPWCRVILVQVTKSLKHQSSDGDGRERRLSCLSWVEKKGIAGSMSRGSGDGQDTTTHCEGSTEFTAAPRVRPTATTRGVGRTKIVCWDANWRARDTAASYSEHLRCFYGVFVRGCSRKCGMRLVDYVAQEGDPRTPTKMDRNVGYQTVQYSVSPHSGFRPWSSAIKVGIFRHGPVKKQPGCMLHA
ncbi:hypothetical protein FB451DRAFT_1167662 [Mycena latifolia]|nr:hypothetical protein FB451DRAFT_1167662 [Mycena latifolia]